MYFFIHLIFNNIIFYVHFIFSLYDIYLFFINYYKDIKKYIAYNDMPYILNNINYDNIIDDNDEIIYNDIIRYNPDYENDIILNNTYYIGLCNIDEDHFIINSVLPLNIFYMYYHDQLLDFLLSYSITENNWQTIEILKIKYDTNNNFTLYKCILKTHFIRLLQKKWKNYLAKKKKYLASSKIIYDLRNREIGIIKFLPIVR